MTPMPLDPHRRGRAPTTAETSLARTGDGRLILRIRHAPLRGITPAMLDWWFRNIGGEMDWQGRSVPRYLVWHPRDHRHWALARPAPGGGVGPGAVFRIVETFLDDPRFAIDVLETVRALGPEGITLEGRIAGLRVSRLSHRFTALDGATGYESCLEVGFTLPVLGPILNRHIVARRFPTEMGRAWIAHNIEEVGQFEQFLPDLWARTRDGAPRP